MKRYLQINLLSATKRSLLGVWAAFLVVLAMNSSVLAAPPVDMYQSMENGSNGNLLTSTLMNASSHGSGWSWVATDGSVWVSTKYARDLPGPVTVGGVTYNGTGSTRTWVYYNNNAMNFVGGVDGGAGHSNITVAGYYTTESTYAQATQYDTVLLEGGATWAVLQVAQNRQGNGHYPSINAHAHISSGSTFGNSIDISAGHTYWFNLKYDGAGGQSLVAIYDPSNGFAQVGATSVAAATAGSTMNRGVRLGRGDNHGNVPGDTSQAWFEHVIVDYTNGAWPLLPSGGGTDSTPPSAPGAVRDGTGTDIAYTSSTTQLSANWDASSDNESGISGYQYAIGTSSGGTQTVNWTSLGNVTTATKSGLSLTSGQTYFFSVKAVNGVGLTGSATNSNGQTVDSSAPSAPANLRDGTGTDIETTSSTTQLSANWDASSDNESGISGYQYAIGTSAGGTQTVNWTSLGNVTTVTKSGLSLTVGQTYYFSVKAVNGAGLTGSATNSNGQTVVSGGGSTTYFSDTFDSWSVHGGAWSSVSGENANHILDTSTDYAKAGTKSLKITDTETTGTSGACLVKNFSPVISGDIYVRFYAYLPTGFGAATPDTRVLRIWCGSNETQFSFMNSPLRPVVEQVGGWTGFHGLDLSENQWYCFEVHVGPPSASTPIEMWVDGTSQGTLVGAYSGSSTFDRIELGDVVMSHDLASRSYYVDEIVVSNSYIGPLGTDATPPSAPATVRDGTGTDISTTTSTTQLSANWDASTDAESGISGYQYAIGTSAGGTQTVNWTSLGNVTTVTKTGLSLTVGQTYFFSVKAVNGAGLTGSATNSNGQTVTSSSTTYFSDNFENWTVHGGTWSSVIGESSSHTLNTSTDQARSGTKGLKLTDTDTTGTNGAYVTKNFSPVISGDIYVRFYLFLPTGYGSTNVAGNARRILRVYCGSNRGQMSIKNEAPMMEEIGAWGSTTGSALSENAWHCIEMHIAPPAASTVLEFWVDGAKNSGTLNANFSASSTFDHMDLGDVVMASADASTGTFYLDELVVSNAYVGTLP